jgi:iron complex transport system ATP-binding protein
LKAASSIFEVRHLRVEREVVILHDVTWRVDPGQHWVILGANGSGKTSLLSALTGYLVPTAGEITIGRARFGATDWRDVRTAVGLVSASLGHRIEPNQTGREVILSGRHAQINLWGRVTPAEEREAARILKQVHAGHLADRPWVFLSQGERQRMLIGRALMARLKILFLDEPCSGLDPVAREDFLGFLEKLARRPHAPTLVLVTHHVEEISPLFTHVLMLHRGRVLACGEKDRVLTGANLGKTFGAGVTLRRTGTRYRLAIAPRGSSFSR